MQLIFVLNVDRTIHGFMADYVSFIGFFIACGPGLHWLLADYCHGGQTHRTSAVQRHHSTHLLARLFISRTLISSSGPCSKHLSSATVR